MNAIYGRVKDIFNPEAFIIAIKIGDTIIIREYDPEKLLEVIWQKFEDISDEDKVRIALEAKKWARGK